MSSRFAVLALVSANVVPLVGVLAWDWSIGTILVLYWLENGIIGASNVVRMVTAAGPIEAHLGKLFLVPFFVVHYGLFWTVHGVFVTTLFGGGLDALGAGAATGPAFGLGGVSSALLREGAGTLGWGVLSLTLSHGVSLVSNYFLGGEYRRVTAAELMARPYGRVVILHLTIIFGAFAALLLGAPIGALLVLVVAKTVVDVGAHLREHRAMQGGHAPASGDRNVSVT